MIEFGHYGLHWLEGDIAVLLQGDGPETAIGLDIDGRLSGRGRCNHAIDLSSSADLPDLSDPLIQAMLPLPRRGRPIPWIDFDAALPLAPLARMSSPIRSAFMPLWSLTPYQLQQELNATNVQPLVLFDIQSQHRPQLDRALTFAAMSPRPVLLIGSPKVPNRPNMERITSAAEVDPNRPWEAIGATVLRNHMLRLDGQTPAST